MAKEVQLHGADMFGDAIEKPHTSKLGEEFLIPPFTVLSAREGWWQDRKRAWLALGIQSELGRGGGQLIPLSDSTDAARYDKEAYSARLQLQEDRQCQP